MKQFTKELGFIKGTTYQLDAGKDWSFKFPPGKQHVALVGLAIDRKIRHTLSLRRELDVLAPLCQYAPYDLMYKGQHIEMKSFSKKTVSISQAEAELAQELLDGGEDMLYMLFEQIEGGRQYEEMFVFRGYIFYSMLFNAQELHPSTKDGGEYFWVANIANLLFD